MTSTALDRTSTPPLADAIREAAALALQGVDVEARRAGAVPPAVRRLSPATCRQRGSQLARFAEHLGANMYPDLASAVEGWAEQRFQDGASVATVAADVSAVRWWARHAGIEGAKDLGADAIADARQDGDRRRRGRGQAPAVDWSAADRIARKSARLGTVKGVRDAAIVAVASDLAARVSEVAALRCQDLAEQSDGSATVDLWQPKTATHRTGYLRVSTVRRLDAWRAAGKVESGPVFRPLTRWAKVGAGPMEARSIADAIRSAAKLAGIRASGHSLRVGAAVSMAARGASLPAMQQAGGWTAPNMPAHYARQVSAKRGPVATLRPEDRWAE